MTTTLHSDSRTHRGRVRTENEDACLARPAAGVFAVADGLGGHAAGEVASALAVEAVEELLATGRDGGPRGASDDPAGEARQEPDGHGSGADDGGARPPSAAGDLRHLRRALAHTVAEANRRIHRQAREDPGQRGMGTTLSVLLLPPGGRWLVGHVGDSRAYLLRDGSLEQLTADHTLFPGSSTLTQALGSQADVEPDILEGDATAGDVFLLCSDGLTDMLSDADIREVLLDAAEAGTGASVGDAGGPAANPDGESRQEGALWGPAAVEVAAEALVEEAVRRGGRDNVTVVLAVVA